jgi:hypothetical protein
MTDLEGFEGNDIEPACSADFLDFHEQYLSKYIQFADAKAGAAAAALTVALGAMLAWDPWIGALRSPTPTWTFGLSALGALLLVGGAVMTFLVIVPRRPRASKGLIAWDAVTGMDAKGFVEAVRAAGPGGLARERLGHCHALARVCRQKYRWLQWGLWTGGVGLALAFIARLIL